MKPLMIAHRGDTVNCQENTLEAFASAFDNGADGIECDVQLVNNELVVVHDFLLDESKNYPKLEEVLAKFGNKGRIEIEIKAFNDELFTNLEDLLSRFPNGDYEITTSELFLIPSIRKHFVSKKIGAIFSPRLFENWMTSEFITRKVLETTKFIQADVSHLPLSLVTKTLVDKLHQNKIKAHTHILKMENIDDEISIYQDISELGVDQCTFDNIYLTKMLFKKY